MDETENVEESSSHITQPTTHEVGKNAKYSYKYYIYDRCKNNSKHISSMHPVEQN